MPQIIAGVSGVNRAVKKIPLGVSGVNRDCKEVWAGVSGVNRKVFNSSVKFSLKEYKTASSGFGIFAYSEGIFYKVNGKGSLSMAIAFDSSLRFTAGRTHIKLVTRYSIDSGGTLVVGLAAKTGNLTTGMYRKCGQTDPTSGYNENADFEMSFSQTTTTDVVSIVWDSEQRQVNGGVLALLQVILFPDECQTGFNIAPVVPVGYNFASSSPQEIEISL